MTSLLTCIFIIFIVGMFYRKRKKVKKRKHPKHILRQRLKSDFPKPFPNSWYFVCLSSDIKVKTVKQFVAFGRTMVVFRNENGNVGILNDACTHLGTSLSNGGWVEGHTIVCPYHEWKFGKDGHCYDIPYCTRDIPERANTKKYHVIEKSGMIFVWYDADEREPQSGIQILDDIKKHYTYIRKTKVDDYHMHIMEPSQNSADWYHFKTVHGYLANPFYKKLLQINHKIDVKYTNKIEITETITKMKLLHIFRLPRCFHCLFKTEVIIESPSLVLFRVSNRFMGEFRTYLFLTPTEPFRQSVLFLSWGTCLFRLFGRIFQYLVVHTVEQDRKVWENKMHVSPRNLVSGDGPFAGYHKWLGTFYSDQSVSSQSFFHTNDW